MEFFKKSEFNCPCCGQNQINNDFLEQLDRARAYAQHFDKDCCVFVITSGYRCGWHNEQKGGHENSLHMKGRAADIAVKSDHHRLLMLSGGLDLLILELEKILFTLIIQKNKQSGFIN